MIELHQENSPFYSQISSTLKDAFITEELDTENQDSVDSSEREEI
jgi:hypothetical protein